ncbi:MULTISPECIES: glycosyltransferase family 39 protein [unclassified Rhodococcus (in: high G+C Gram-positive bacteria)]|uniref:ArnT family glycosyltransferase n=1 Tax=unclassified Rhodococcus (in: high G+C Gram-positive bacteria) TaxID=192944 RepID=UPI00163A8BA9|nr:MULTISPECIES: glycosyltransferase family 39 protein [unclassified Rhodococcus (in: high G+C Gram-positive bacteria)]MBC2639955.1 glycosyltransferase family 39 protein [Rhodococcus sp. 3A]MBC2895298.1 glycosyltransferase family 39 protein [Rhodococcus sp. 4CII]
MTTTLEEPKVESPPPPPTRRRWEPWALGALLAGTAVAYIWGLGASGWANSFYAAAVQAGSVSWKAFFFGSSDAANSITVDKPPMSLWLMSLSVRIFGLSSWAMLVPQALLGVGSVALLYATVKRWFGAPAGLLAGLVLALTPIAVLMFRFNNPDALLVLLMIAAVWAMLRAVEDGRTRWMVLTGVFVGLGFLTKQLQVMLVVPPLALTYLVAGPPKFGKRLAQCFAALGAMIVSAGWWLLTVELWPASSRPWIGGSQNNSILELTLGYNGLGRLNGEETGSVTPGGNRGDAAAAMVGAGDAATGGGMAAGGPGGGMPAGGPGGGGGMWGSTGITRMFESAQGGQIAWLIPAALILLVAGLALRGRAPRVDTQRASFLVWGLWLLVTGLTFSFMAGIFHAYYTVALAPAVAALVAIGSVTLWRRRDASWVRAVLAVTLLTTAVMSWVLLGRSASFVPWLKWAVVVVGILAAVAVLIPASTRGRIAAVVVLAALFTGLAGPTAYAVNTIATPHTGSIVSAGPTVEGGRGGFGGMGGPGGMDGAGRMGRTDGAAGATMPAMPGGAAAGATDGMGGFGGGAAGGLLSGSNPGTELVSLLEQNSGNYTWVAAAIGSNSASGYQLATEDPVMPIGGFNGSDPSPTLEQFQQYVADGRIHYFISGGRGGGMGGDGTASEISTWVEANFTAVTVDGVTLYDLTS